MKSETIITNGFRWRYWPCPKKSESTMIVVLGGASEGGILIKAAVKCMHEYGCNAVTFVPVNENGVYDGWHDFPLDRIEEIALYLLDHGSRRVGIGGASTTSLVSLAAASRIPQLSLVLSFATEDYNTEGFYMGKAEKGGIGMIPANGHSMFTWRGEPVPFSVTNLTAKQMDEMIHKDKEGNMMNALQICAYYESLDGFEEALHPVENAHALICAFGSDSDVGCDSGRMVRRMEKRLRDHHYAYGMEMHVYPVCSHYQFPETMIKNLLPFGSQFLMGKMWAVEKNFPQECIRARKDIDRVVRKAVEDWKNR